MKTIKYKVGQYVRFIENKNQVCQITKVKRLSLEVAPLRWDKEKKKFLPVKFLSFEMDKKKFIFVSNEKKN